MHARRDDADAVSAYGNTSIVYGRQGRSRSLSKPCLLTGICIWGSVAPAGPSGNRKRPPWPFREPQTAPGLYTYSTSPGPAPRRWHLRRWGWGACCHAGECLRSPMEATARGAHTPFATLEGICKHRLFRLGKFALAFQFQRFQNSKRVFASNRNLNFPQRDQCY